MHTGILPLLVILALILATETMIYDLSNRITINAGQTEKLHVPCYSNSTYVNQIYVFSAKGDVIGKDDTFQVRTKVDCSSNSYINKLSSQNSDQRFTWSGEYPGQFIQGTGVCVEIQCTNFLFACSIGYGLRVNCL